MTVPDEDAARFDRSRYPDRRSVPLVRVADFEALKNAAPGAFYWTEEGGTSYFHVLVPYYDWMSDRDGAMHAIPVFRPGQEPSVKTRASWVMHNEDLDHPVLKPSLLCWTWPPNWQDMDARQARVEAWHGYVEGTILKSC